MRSAGLADESPSPGGPAVVPAAASDAPPRWRISVRRTFLCQLAAAALFACAIAVGRRMGGALGLGAFCALMVSMLFTMVFGIQTLVRVRRETRKPSWSLRILVGAVTLFAGSFFFGFGTLVVLMATRGFSRGRQLRRLGKVLLPEVEPGAGWNERSVQVSAPSEVLEGLSAQWRENGRTEHASIAAFARLTLDLMALGAPPKLLESAQKDAQDEIRHAELCFSLARSFDGRAERPAAFPQAQRARTLSRFRTLALAQLAVDSLIDGALHEGTSARVIARLSQRCEDEAIRSVLKTLAADEGRHTAHGWDVVEWCLKEGGWPVERAVAGALRTVPRAMRAELPEAARGGAWERFGIPGEALEADEYAKARAELIRRVERMISAPLAVAA